MKKLLLGYDVMTYNGEMPNCLEPKYLESIYNATDFDFKNSGEGFKQAWGVDWPLYNGGFWDNVAEKKSIYEILQHHRNEQWFYMVEPFGNVETFFGNNPQQKLLLENISSVALKEIQQGNGYLMISYLIDGGLGVTRNNFQKIIDFTKKNWIPDEKVILVFQDFKLKENLASMNVNYKVLDFNLALLSKANEFVNTLRDPYWSFWGPKGHDPQLGKVGVTRSTVATYQEFETSIGHTKKDFLFFCRRWKLHRLLAMSKIHKMGIENSYVSWDKRFFEDWKGSVDLFLRHDDNTEFLELIKNTNSILDVEDIVRIAGYGFEDKRLYLKSYISIAAESIFFQDDTSFPSGYLSEKIWKPIGHAQPFILMGPHKSLEYIRSLGFQTFHPFIDESYDDEKDGMVRLQKILHEMEKFAMKTKQEKDEFLHNVKHIVRHNHEKFLNYPNVYKQDSMKMVEEMYGTI